MSAIDLSSACCPTREVPPAPNIAKAASVAALIGDPARLAMLVALAEGTSLRASTLADISGISPQTASGHLAKMAAANLIHVEPRGRCRYHHIASEDVVMLLGLLTNVTGPLDRCRHHPGHISDPSFRNARACWDHLAGRLGVELAEACLDGAPRPGPTGLRRLERWGLDLDRISSTDRPLCRLCEDWSEQRPHIGGALGSAILGRSLALDWVRPRRDSRALIVTHAGRAGFRATFGVIAAG